MARCAGALPTATESRFWVGPMVANAALQSAATDPSLYKTVVAIAPVTDLAMVKDEARNFSNYELIEKLIGSGTACRRGLTVAPRRRHFCAGSARPRHPGRECPLRRIAENGRRAPSRRKAE